MSAIGGPKWLREFRIRMRESNIGHALEALHFYYKLSHTTQRFCDLSEEEKKNQFLKMKKELETFFERPDQNIKGDQK